jgi:hypothetical protein
MPAYRDPDDVLVVLFKYFAVKNAAKTLAEGRPIFDDMEVCEIRAPGSRDVKVFPANEFARWVLDPDSGEQVKQSYAERFSHQYRQFKASAAQTKSGTPLEHARFLTDGRRAELKAQNIYTVEALADVEGAELKNLGPGGRDMKNAAMSYIEEGKASAPTKQMQAELEALRARNAVLEEDMQAKKSREIDEGEFAGMTDDQLKEYVTTHTGFPPQGKNSRKTLVRMATECRPDKVA